MKPAIRISEPIFRGRLRPIGILGQAGLAAVFSVLAVLVIGSLLPANGATVTWEGGTGKNANTWNRKQNWSSSSVPGASDTALFDNSANASNLAPTIGASNRSIGAITFSSGTTNAYDISGTATLTVGSVAVSGITNSSATAQAFSVGTVALGVSQSWSVAGAGGLSVASAVTLGSNDLTLLGSGTGVGRISGVVSGTGDLVKGGTGTWALSGANTFSGTTVINQGVLTVMHATGLGATSAGTTVAGSGAALHLDSTIHGNLTIADEPLTLFGTGVGGAGALRNIAGDNSLAGDVTIGSGTRIAANTGTSLTLSGDVTAVNQALAIGAVTESGDVTLAGSLNLGTGSLVIDGAGATSLSGVSNTVGEVQLNAGTFSIGAGSTLTTAEFESAAGSTLVIGSGGSVLADYAEGTSIFSGAIDASAGGTFQKTGAGTLVFDHSFNAGGNSTLVLGGGTLSLLGGAQVSFGTIRFTGDTVLDFNGTGGTFLSSANLIIDDGVLITVKNWTAIANNAAGSTIWYATGTVNGSPLGGSDQVGGAPLDRISFDGFNQETTLMETTWVSGSGSGWFDHEIRPTPEPAAYGALLVLASLGLMAWRRFRVRKTAAA